MYAIEASGIVPVTDEDDQRQAVPELVRTGGGLGRVGPGHLVQEPVRGSAKALLVLLTVKASWSVLVSLKFCFNFPHMQFFFFGAQQR